MARFRVFISNNIFRLFYLAAFVIGLGFFRYNSFEIRIDIEMSLGSCS